MISRVLWAASFSLAVFSFAVLPVRAAYEIADVGQVGADFKGYTYVWIDSGTNPISTPEQWEAYVPPAGYIKNTPRNGEFNDEELFSSPGVPPPDVIPMTDPNGYTWKLIAKTQSAMWSYEENVNPYEEAAFTTTPQPGYVKFSSNEKNQEMIFWARENNEPDGALILRYFITDQWGNKYIMGASGAETDAEIPDAFESAVLPEGWVKSTGYLDKTLHLFPAYGAGNQAHYNIFRESGDNTFFQMSWGEDGITLAAQIEDMPIWGGVTNDRILGRAGDDNLIHGAEGDDLIFVLGQNDSIYGDAGVDTIVLAGNFEDYLLEFYGQGGAEIVLAVDGLKKSIYDAEFLQFDNLTIATSAVPEPSTAVLVVGMALACLARRR